MKKKRILTGLLSLTLFLGVAGSLASCDVNKNNPDPVVEPEATLSSISVSAQSETVVKGKTYTPSASVKVTATYSDKSTKDVTSSAKFSTVDTQTLGEKTVTVTYDGKTATYTVSVVEAAITMNGTEYATIKEALAAIPTENDTATYTIVLQKGTYEENGLAYKGTATVKIKGATSTKYGADVIIKGHGSDMTQEKTRNLISVQGTGNIILENVTLQSDWSRTRAAQEGKAANTQAEVLGTDTKGNTVAYNCSFKSNQDTLRTAGKAWFYGCYIEGDVDFIWMEQAGSVALYEKCEIVSVYDETASSHASYVAAPRMSKTNKVGKGLVIYNSTVKETAEAKEKGQETYLARNPWSSTTDYFNQVAYINTTCEDIEETLWKGAATVTEYDPLAIGWKMDAATATSLNYTGTDGVLSADVVSKEFNGRETILNRLYNVQKQKYEKDNANYWDIAAFITENGWTVDADQSSSTLATDTAGASTIYKFDGTEDVSSIVTGFNAHSSGSYAGGAGSTITVPVTGKCYVEVYGFYSGTVEVTADTQDGEGIMFFNNNSTSAEIVNTYAVYDEAARSVVITAKATTYITKVIVTEDVITEEKATGITIGASTTTECVGVPLTLSGTITNKTATNKSIKWSSSDPTIATIDEYTGKVTFVAAGEVTFTATACDGSGVTATKTCKPIDPKWTAAEWYTTDSTVAEEESATEIGNFNTNSSAYKGLTKTYTFTNIAGNQVSTSKGLKLNSAGKLSIATTKGNATLTVVIVTENGQLKATPIVHCGDTKAELIGEAVVNTDTTTTYVFALPTAGSWDIERGDTQSENNPILYVKCEYDLSISKNTFVNYKGGTYHAQSTDAVALNHNNDSASKVDSTASITFDNFTYSGAQSNGNDNWLKFNTGATITFKAKSACKLVIYFYNGQNNATVTLAGTAVTTATSSEGATYATGYEYDITAGGEVVITAASNGYLGAFEVIFPAE